MHTYTHTYIYTSLNSCHTVSFKQKLDIQEGHSNRLINHSISNKFYFPCYNVSIASHVRLCDLYK